ncbi:MAG: murein biosynthesis integral membrane protein MurJ [Treponema sp.]|nr:murein biosynthesis integral membrane protein MurJ [Treponema sp.]
MNSELEKNSDIQNKTKRNSHKKGLLKSGISLSVLTLVSRIFGLLRQVTLAKFLGTSSLSDAYQVAFNVPNLFRRLFAENSISVAFIPTFRGYLEKADTPEGKKEAQNFVSATLTLLSFITVSFVTVCIIFTPLLMRIFYKEGDTASITEATLLTRIMFPYLALISIAAFFQGILNTLKIFSPSGFTPILFNGIVIASAYILSPHMANPARAMAIGVVAGGTVQAFFQLPFVLKNNWKVTFTSLKNAFTHPGTRRVLALIGPTIIGMAAYQVNDLVSSALATRTGEGVFSSLSYSLRMQELILGICAVTIGTVILPDLTAFANKNQWNEFSSMLSNSLKIMAFIAIPITFYSLLMDRSLISLLFQTGEFDSESTEMTTNVFRCHIIGLYFIALNRILAPAFYAQQDTIRPTLAGIINFAVNIILAAIFSRIWGGPGIAIALTIASFVNTVVLFIFLARHKNISNKVVLSSTILYSLRMILFSVIASVPVYFLRGKIIEIFQGHHRFISQGVPVVITGLIFAVIGVGLMIVTRDPLIKSITRKFKR